MKSSYIRLITNVQSGDTRDKLGVFAVAYNLLREGTLHPSMRKQLDDYLTWFEDHLDTPLRFNKSGKPHKTEKALSWFKPSAITHIHKARGIAAILVQHGISVEILKTVRPGYIVFEDEYQVTAQPFNDTPR